MVYTQSFSEHKAQIFSLNAQNKKVSETKRSTKKKMYLEEGKTIYRGNPPLGKKYAPLQIGAANVHKLPGIRGQVFDVVNKIWKKKAEYYNYFTQGFVSLGLAGAVFFVLPYPYVLSAFPFIWFGFLSLMKGHNNRVACWEFEMNMGYIAGMNFEPGYRKNKYWGMDNALKMKSEAKR